MGRHVNFADEQDRWLNKADKINRKYKSTNLEDREPGSLTLAEQFELAKRRKKEQQRIKDEKDANPKKEEIRFSHYRPK